MVNCVWITADSYYFSGNLCGKPSANGVDECKHARVFCNSSKAGHGIMGPVFGAMFGIILGLFAFVASKIMKK